MSGCGKARARWAAVALAASLTLVAGCTDDGNTINEQARAGDQKGYISGDGTVQQLVPADRTVTVDLSGTTLEGEPWSTADHRGEVVVINVWGSWCAPCKEEAPELQAAWSELSESHAGKVQFIGVNDRDGVETAKAFQESKGLTFPSLADDGGASLLALRGMANARPSTLVLDADGKVAARVLGPVDEATLRGMVEDVLGS